MSPENILKVLKKESKEYIKARNDIIGEEEKKLMKAMRGESVEKQKKLLIKFQKTIGKRIVKLVDKEHIMINAEYFPWDSKEIKFPIDTNGANFKAKDIFLKLLPA